MSNVASKGYIDCKYPARAIGAVVADTYTDRDNGVVFSSSDDEIPNMPRILTVALTYSDARELAAFILRNTPDEKEDSQ